MPEGFLEGIGELGGQVAVPALAGGVPLGVAQPCAVEHGHAALDLGTGDQPALGWQALHEAGWIQPNANFFGEIPRAELVTSIARRVSDGRMLGLIKKWLEMPVEEDDGKGGKRRTNRARKERKGTPQGSPKVLTLGIPTIRDRVVQGALKLILEPVFEADFQDGS